jgi:tetratricopeptide (TPR) repeat protein
VAPALLLLVLLGLPALVFARIVAHDFVLWDDTIEIYKNPYLDLPTWQAVAELWRHPYINLYVPVSYTAFALLAAVARLPAPDPALGETGALLDPRVFHAASCALHLLNTLLVFAVLRLLLAGRRRAGDRTRQRPGTRPGAGKARPLAAAAAGALVFALHPVQVESVAWASELRGVLCGTFSLLCIWLYLRRWGPVPPGDAGGQGDPDDPPHLASAGGPVAHPWPAGRSAAFMYAGALLAGAMAMLAKPSAVSLPVVLLALDRWGLRRPWRACLAGAAPFLALAVPMVLLTQDAQPVRPEIVAPLWQRPFVAGDALAFYLRQLVLPVGLGIDYGRTPARVLAGAWGHVAWLVPVAAALLAWWAARRAAVERDARAGSWMAAAGAVSLAALLPVLGLVPFAFQYYSTVADRYLYLAMLGPALAVSWWLARGRSAAAWAAVGALLAAWAVLSFVQAGTWRDSVTLLGHAIQVNPASDVSFANRGMALARRGRLDGAEVDIREALRLNAGNYKAHSNLGNVLLLRGRREAAIAEYRAAIAIEPGWAESHSNLGMALAMRHDLDEAAAQFAEALRLDPRSASARSGLKQVLASRRRQPGEALPPGR